MDLLQVIVLAVIQGITEFLPVSSHAHLIVAPMLLGWKDPGLTFDIALHAGTLAAVVIFFFRDWLQVIAQGVQQRCRRIGVDVPRRAVDVEGDHRLSVSGAKGARLIGARRPS